MALAMKALLKKKGVEGRNSVLATAAGLALVGGEFMGVGGAVGGAVVGAVVALWSNMH